MKRKFAWLSAVTALLTTAAFADQQVLYVNVDSVDILDSPVSVALALKTVPLGTVLNVESLESGWYKVKAEDNTEGFVYTAAISPDKPNFNALSAVGGAGVVSTAAAAKGLEPTATDYAKSKNQSPDMLNALIDFRTHITAKEFLDFAAAGKVGKVKLPH